MAHGSAVLKALLLLIISVDPSSADTHSFQYFYTGVTPGTNLPEFTVVGLVDGEQVMYYDSSTRQATIMTEWMKKVDDEVAAYWREENLNWREEQEWMKIDVEALKKRFNHTKGVVQIMFGCELDDNGTTRASSQFAYDGEDFIRLDLTSVTWNLVRPQAVITEKKWDPTGHEAAYCTSYLNQDCNRMLKKFVLYGKEKLERKVGPEVSLFQKHSSPSPEVVCHTTGFLPKALNIIWQKDGEDVHEDVELRETLPNQDGSFQKRSILKVPAEELQKHTYTCVVQHSSLEKELVREVPKGGGSDGGSDGGPDGGLINAISIGVTALAVLGIVVVGIVIWKQKNSAFRPVPQNSNEALPMKNLPPEPLKV